MHIAEFSSVPELKGTVLPDPPLPAIVTLLRLVSAMKEEHSSRSIFPGTDSIKAQHMQLGLQVRERRG